jgi:3-oxoacyl-[acyl-carrier protein] reductase
MTATEEVREMDDRRLRGRVAIVTGAARGIGFASARRLAAAGASVLLSDLDEQALAEARRELGGETAGVAGDLTEVSAPNRLVDAALERWGRVDIVFNNAGYNWDAPLVELTDEQFQAMLDVHLLAPFRLLRAAGPHMLAAAEAERARGEEVFRKVINSSSISGTMGNPNQANYNAAKAAIVGLTKGLAKEWGRWKINVNAIAPGFIDTRLTALTEEAGQIQVGGHDIQLGIPEEHRRNGSANVPLGRPGSTDEVARVVEFLASSASDYITGQVVSVTGGVTLGMSA